LIDRADGKLVINPGAAGPRRFELRPSVGILVLGEAAGGGAEVEIVEL
jgi:hypothetical protein